MSERGVFAVDRGVWNHPALQSDEPFTKREAWLWMVSEAAWKSHKKWLGGKVVEIKRGQLSHSVRFMADAWGWHRAKVDRFLKILKSETMIETQSETGQNVITICNYDEYQRVSLPDRDTKQDTNRDSTETAARQQRDKLEDIENKEIDFVGARARVHETEFHDNFWPLYPHQVGKPTALKEFCQARKRATLPQILRGLERYASNKPADRKWMNPAKFLREDRWLDQPAPNDGVQERGHPQSDLQKAFSNTRRKLGIENEPSSPTTIDAAANA